jgi:hypothetical protein
MIRGIAKDLRRSGWTDARPLGPVATPGLPWTQQGRKAHGLL